MPRIAIALHYLYKRCVSPLWGDVCRFAPSCSDYAFEAISRFGWLKGSFLAVKRLLKCHPYCAGGFDPVPARSGGCRDKTNVE